MGFACFPNLLFLGEKETISQIIPTTLFTCEKEGEKRQFMSRERAFLWKIVAQIAGVRKLQIVVAAYYLGVKTYVGSRPGPACIG